MNKKVTVAVGVAAAVAFAGVASANNTQTIMSSEAYVPLSIASGFVPEFVTQDCTSGGATGIGVVGNTGNCNGHGAVAASAAAGVDIGEGLPGYFNNPDMMPVFNTTVFNVGMEHSGYANIAPFASGLFRRSQGGAVGGRSNYFTGLMNAWTGLDEALTAGDKPMGVGTLAGDHTERELWIDQTVVGYVMSLDANGDSNYDQNFRAQLSWDGADLATSLAHIDQRLEQDLTLQDGGTPFEASKQTLQMAFAAASDTGATTNPDALPGGAANLGAGGSRSVAQLVTQDVEGWFFSCIGCDTPELGTTGHAFEPADQQYTFMPYTTTWNSVPTITHAPSAAEDPLRP